MKTKTDLHNLPADIVETLRQVAQVNAKIAHVLNGLAEALGIEPEEFQGLLAAIDACPPRLHLIKGGKA